MVDLLEASHHPAHTYNNTLTNERPKVDVQQVSHDAVHDGPHGPW